MSDTPNPAPAGAESAPAPAPSFEPMNEAKALEQLLALEGGDDEPQVSEAPAGDEDVTPENTDEPEDAPEGDETGETADEEPADDAAEPQPNEAASSDDETGTRMHRLRDGTQVSLGDLKKAYDEARGYRQALPQIQAERARIEQEKQAVAAREQQFQPQLALVANILQQQITPAPDPALLESDPIEFHNQRWMHEQSLARLQQANAAHAEAQAKAQQQEAANVEAAKRAAIQQFIAFRPEMNEEANAKKFVEGREKLRTALGFTQEAMQSVTHPGLHELTRLAILGLEKEQTDKSQAAVKTQKTTVAAKKVAGKPPVAAPTARVGTNVRQAEVARGAMDRLRKNPSNQDAQIAALMALEQ